MGRRPARGFTLIEVMVTVAIIAILSAVALPSYRDYVVRSRLVDATSALSSGRARMEQYFQDNHKYSSVSATIKPPCLTSQTVSGWTVGCRADPGDSSYTISATGSGMTEGFAYSINQANDQRTTSLPQGWGTVPPGSSFACWITRKGGACP